jgi:hypothetical protein
MTFFVLWIFIGGGNSQAIATDHYSTLAECEAAKTAIVQVYGDNSFKDIADKQVMCLEAKVK